MKVSEPFTKKRKHVTEFAEYLQSKGMIMYNPSELINEFITLTEAKNKLTAHCGALAAHVNKHVPFLSRDTLQKILIEYYEKNELKVSKKDAIDNETFQLALQLLRNLHDLQNGVPLERYKDEWETTMNEIDEFLGEHE